MMSSYQQQQANKGDVYAPQSSGAPGPKDPQEYEILEAGLVHNVNATGGARAAGWGSNADMEKALRLGEYGVRFLDE